MTDRLDEAIKATVTARAERAAFVAKLEPMLNAIIAERWPWLARYGRLVLRSDDKETRR